MLLLKAGDEETAEYKEVAGFLLGLRKNSKDLANFYVLRKEGEKMFFLADDAYLESPDDFAKIGEEYTDYDEALIQGFTKATASPNSTRTSGGHSCQAMPRSKMKSGIPLQ